jgi:hypothetical protein
MKIIFFILIFIFIITAFSVYSNVENFSNVTGILGKKDDSEKTDESKKKDEPDKPDRYKYFKMVPENNKWSDKTTEDFKKKFKEMNPNATLTPENMQMYQKFASEQETQEYIKNGSWPLNDYIKDNIKLFIKNAEGIKNEDKEKTYNEYVNSPFFNLPNSLLLFYPVTSGLVNNMTKLEDYVGQPKFMYLSGPGVPLENDGKLNCKCKNYNDQTCVPSPFINSNEITEENYPSLEKNIPGFKFLKKPCNPCTNRCPYSYEGVLAAPYAKYWGISSETGKSTPSEYKTKWF